jgi:hypothetical protein
MRVFVASVMVAFSLTAWGGPGTSSQAMAISTGGGPYHCSIHPSMVGTIVPAGSTPTSLRQ